MEVDIQFYILTKTNVTRDLDKEERKRQRRSRKERDKREKH